MLSLARLSHALDMGNGNIFIQVTHAFNDSKIPFIQTRVLKGEPPCMWKLYVLIML